MFSFELEFIWQEHSLQATFWQWLNHSQSSKCATTQQYLRCTKTAFGIFILPVMVLLLHMLRRKEKKSATQRIHYILRTSKLSPFASPIFLIHHSLLGITWIEHEMIDSCNWYVRDWIYRPLVTVLHLLIKLPRFSTVLICHIIANKQKITSFKSQQRTIKIKKLWRASCRRSPNKVLREVGGGVAMKLRPM